MSSEYTEKVKRQNVIIRYSMSICSVLYWDEQSMNARQACVQNKYKKI